MTTQPNGIDDYLAGQPNQEESLRILADRAKPFIETIAATPFDLHSVSSEILKVRVPALLREQLSKPLAERLGIKVEVLRKIGKEASSRSDFVDLDPYPEPVVGHQVLDDVAAMVVKHVIVDDHSKVAITLWSVLVFLIDLVDIMPLLAILSPEKRCGKTRLLTLLLKLVRRPIPGVSLTAATIYRAIEKWHPTLLIDEADGILKDSRGRDNVELRNVINSGVTREIAYVPRCVGDRHDVQRFSTWAPKAIALIGRMPDSMFDRSIAIQMRRKAKNEKVAKIRETAPEVFAELQRKIVRFVQDNGEQIAGHEPILPEGLNDRAEDCWIPLLAIAEIAGGRWPELARNAAKALSSDADNDTDTLQITILRAVEETFVQAKKNNPDGFLSTKDICDKLNRDDEAPWADFPNKMTRELLARNLRPFKVKSEQVKVGEERHRGFFWEKLEPVLNRYL